MLIEFLIRPSDDHRIKDVQADWADWVIRNAAEYEAASTLLVVHTNHEYQDLDKWIEIDRSGGGVLFVTGGPTGELANLKGELLARRPEIGWPSRWLVLTTPIAGVGVSAELRGRFGRFLEECATLTPWDSIPWDRLYSLALSETVLAVYLWCLAQPSLATGGITTPDEMWRIGSEAWADLCKLSNERGMSIPPRAQFNSCLDLNRNACEAFAGWVKEVLLPSLA